MNGAGTIDALVVMTVLSGSAAARGGLGTYTCVDRAGSLASDGSACRSWVDPYESAASAAERQAVLERMRARKSAQEQEAAAARVNRLFDAQLKRLRPLWRQPEHP